MSLRFKWFPVVYQLVGCSNEETKKIIVISYK